MSELISPSNCPLCSQANQCAVAAGLPAQTCWCMQASIAPDVLARLPEQQGDKSCICATCGQVKPLSPLSQPEATAL